jgi:predicted nucleic acid-binding Zn ribbon protein
MASPGNLAMDRAGRLIAKMKMLPDVADAESHARAAWAAAAGPKIARHTRARCVVRKTLVVEVGDATWQRQLSTLRHFLLRNLAKELGPGVIEEIDFRPMPARREPQRAGSARPSREGIADPVMALIYEQARRRAQ